VPISPERALNILIEQSGTSLDALLLKVFVNMIGVYPIGTLLLLDTGEVGMVSQTPPGAVQGRPLCVTLAYESGVLKRGSEIDLSLKARDGRFLRNILRCVHPTEFGLTPADTLAC
jgi:hypothetical protein